MTMRWIAAVVLAAGVIALQGCDDRRHTAPAQAEKPAPTPTPTPAPAAAHAHDNAPAPNAVTPPAAHAGHAHAAADNALGGPHVGASPAAGSSDEKISVVNAYCPILVGQAVGEHKMCDRRLTRTFKGRVIGFCDPECVSAWDGFADEQRQKYLDDALALETAPKP